MFIALLTLFACTDTVSSDREAELAYLGLDLAVEKALGLGLDGFNAASSANIPPQTAAGEHSGQLTVSGQVDQGASDNKGLRLDLTLEAYADDADLDDDEDTDLLVTYDTDAEEGLPALDLQLRDIPDGTLTGTFIGSFFMSDDLEGEVVLNVNIDGLIEEDSDGGVRRVAGETTIVGTATNASDGVYEIDLVR